METNDPQGLPLLREGRYDDFKVAGEGGMGIVYWALDTDLNRQVAFKVVRPDAGSTGGEAPPVPIDLAPPALDTPASKAFETLKARFLQEVWVTAGLEHPGIVPVYELGETPEGVPYYTMRFVRGSQTLATAIEEVREKPVEERLALLESFLRICDTIRYAHAHGVIHRDLKPRNVAIGEFGEVVVLDWGLAKIRDREDLAAEMWQERLREYREAADLHTIPSAMGTPGYMAPEAALGRIAELDERCDVYSLGAILFEILTGRLPFEFANDLELINKLRREDPLPATECDAAVPAALSAVCATALAREKEERFDGVAELSEAIRGWQRESAEEREVRELLAKAEASFDGTEGLEGEALLKQIDRVTSACSRIEEKSPEHPRPEELVAKCEAIRERAIAERERAARRKVMRRVAALAAVVLVAVAGVVVLVVDSKRREAEAAERAKEKALAEVLRLADGKKVRDLLAEVERLWPIHPDRAGAMADWLARARELLSNRSLFEDALGAVRARALPYMEEDRLRDHADELAKIRELKDRLKALEETRARVIREASENANEKLDRLDVLEADTNRSLGLCERRVRERGSWSFLDSGDAWQEEVLADLVAGLSKIADGAAAVRKTVEARRALADGLAASIEEHRTSWEETIAAIADEEANPAYGGLAIAPILGVVPLGKDPGSGLYEFAHLGSGRVPVRDAETGELAYAEDAAIVLALLPGGTFRMGAQKEDPAGPNYDPQVEEFETPVREVALRPFLIAKHECTQAQWAALTEGERPSYYGPGAEKGGRKVTDRHPAENVSYSDATLWLGRHRLRLPSEAEWEYACRAGTETPWVTGREVTDLGEVANICDAFCKSHRGPSAWRYTEEVDDGYAVHAPVGSFRANGFGLFDMHGNVSELCADWSGRYRYAPTDGTARTRQAGATLRIYRGGCWNGIASFCRSSIRGRTRQSFRDNYLGIRPATSP